MQSSHTQMRIQTQQVWRVSRTLLTEMTNPQRSVFYQVKGKY